MTIEQIQDLVNGTLQALGPPRFAQIAQRLTSYPAADELLRKSRVKTSGGKYIERRVTLKHSDVARFVELYEPDALTAGDVLDVIKVPWRHIETSYIFDKRELAVNSGSEQIVDLITLRRMDALLSLAATLEEAWWTAIGSDSSKEPHGLPYWIVEGSSKGFTGLAPAGETTVGGIDPSVNEHWRNYYAPYSAITETDLLDSMSEALYKIDFKTPDIADSPAKVFQIRKTYKLYTTLDVLREMERLAKNQNDQLGFDLDPASGKTTFRRLPLTHVPMLDESASATQPIYMINMDTIETHVLRGEYLRETKAKELPGVAHNTLAVWLDLSYNTLCIDRRRNALFTLAE